MDRRRLAPMASRQSALVEAPPALSAEAVDGFLHLLAAAAVELTVDIRVRVADRARDVRVTPSLSVGDLRAEPAAPAAASGTDGTIVIAVPPAEQQVTLRRAATTVTVDATDAALRAGVMSLCGSERGMLARRFAHAKPGAASPLAGFVAVRPTTVRIHASW
jgi:hypothetical protein